MILDPKFGLIDYLDTSTLMSNPNLFKVETTKDPDISNIGEAMSEPNRVEFLKAMRKEITWEVVKGDSIKPNKSGVKRGRVIIRRASLLCRPFPY